eukprot:UN19697
MEISRNLRSPRCARNDIATQLTRKMNIFSSFFFKYLWKFFPGIVDSEEFSPESHLEGERYLLCVLCNSFLEKIPKSNLNFIQNPSYFSQMAPAGLQ